MYRILICCCISLLTLEANARAQAPKASSPDLKAMYEDIEILRRILAKELGAGSGPTASYFKRTNDATSRGIEWLTRTQNAPPSSSNSAYQLASGLNANAYFDFDMDGRLDVPARRGMPTTIEGVYLKGHGVTYTLAVNAAEQVVYNASNKGVGLISICIKCHAPASAERYLNTANPNRPAPKLSEWEKTRNDIRGDKTEPQPSYASFFLRKDICAPGNLTERILKVLADNGYQFQQLPGGENITVVFTFSAHSASGESPRNSSATPPWVSAMQHHTELGDLHLKQQKYAEAIHSYTDVIKLLTEHRLAFAADAPYEETARHIENATLILRGCYTKQAQALLALGKTAEAKDTLNKAESAKIQLNNDAKTPAEKISPNLPAKLLITVSKKALDQHHEGKLTLEQLRKEAEVQAINLPPAEKKP